MTTLGGFDTSRSLLPVGGGTIQAMSGGGIGGTIGGDISGGTIGSGASLIPDVKGPMIVGLHGGSIGEPSEQKGDPDEEKVQPLTTATVVPVQQMVVPPPTTVVVVPVAQNGTPPPPSMNPVPQNGTPSPLQNGLKNGPKNGPKNQLPSLNEGEKRVPIFGTMYSLKKPKNNATSFDETQRTVLQKLGLDGAKPELQRSVLKSLYEEACDTTRSLITMRSCEPFRQIVRSLALRYLNKMNGVKEEPVPETPKKPVAVMEEPQKVEPVDEPVALTNDERLDSMIEGLVSVYGMSNPGKAVSCYCNSVVQLLFSLPEIRVAILSYPCAKPLTEEDMKRTEANPSRVLCALREVFQGLMKDATTMDHYTAPEGTNLPQGIPQADRIQYIMGVYTASKQSTVETRQDASEFLSYLLDEVFSMDEHVKGLVDAFRFTLSRSFRCNDEQNKWSDEKKNAVHTTLPLLQGSSTTASEALLEYFKPHTTDGSKGECQGLETSKEKQEMLLSNQNKYVLMELQRTAEGSEITVTPRIELSGKKYVFHGAILYKTESGGHYSYHLVPSAFIHEDDTIKTLEGIPFMNYSDLTVSKNNLLYPLSKQARLLVYRSEAGIDEWESHVRELRKKLQREVKKAPTLVTGDAYVKELHEKIPSEDRTLLEEVQALVQKEKAHGASEAPLEETSKQQLERVRQLVAKIEQQSASINNHAIEGLENEINQVMEAHQHILHYDPLVTSKQRRATIKEKSNEIMRAKEKIDTTILQPEFTKDVSLAGEWPSLHSKVSARIDDRRNVLKNYQEAFLESQKEIHLVEMEEKKMEYVVDQYIEQVAMDLQQLGQKTQPSGDETSYESQLREEFKIKTAQEYYNEMIQSQDYLENEEKLRELEGKIRADISILNLSPPPIELDVKEEEKVDEKADEKVDDVDEEVESYAPPVFIDEIPLVQEGGSLDEMTQWVSMCQSYQGHFREFNQTLLTKDAIVATYQYDHLQSPYEKLLQKDGMEEDKSLSSMDRLRHMVVRHRLLKECVTVIQEFTGLVNTPKESHRAEYAQLSNEVSEAVLKQMNANTNDFTNALYHSILIRAINSPFSDLFSDPKEILAHNQLMESWSPLDVSPLEKELTTFQEEIRAYNEIASDAQRYTELPPLYQKLTEHITQLDHAVEEKEQHVQDFWIEPHSLNGVTTLSTFYQHERPVFTQRYETLQTDQPIPVLTLPLKEAFEKQLEIIGATLERWALSVEEYYSRVQQHNVTVDEANDQLDQFQQRILQSMEGIHLDATTEAFDPSSYRTEYKKTLLGDSTWLDTENKEDATVPNSLQRIAATEATYQGIKSELDRAFLDLLEIGEFQPFKDASSTYEEQSSTLMKTMEGQRVDLQTTLETILSQKQEIESSRAAFEEQVDQLIAKIHANTQTNQSSTSLSAATPLSLQQTIQKVEVRKELRDQIQLKRDEFHQQKEALDQKARDLDTKGIQMEQIQSDLEQKAETLMKKFTDLFVIEGTIIKASIDAIRTSAKITAKMNTLQTEIQQLEKNMERAPNNNAAPLRALIEQKRQKLESLTQSHAEQQTKITREVSNEAVNSHPNELTLDESLTTLLQAETSGNVASLTQMLDLVNQYMDTTYSSVEWTADKIKAILTHVKRQLSDLHNIVPKLSIVKLISADDFLLLFFHAAVEKGYLTEEANPYAAEIKDHQEAIRASTDPLGEVIRSLEHLPVTDTSSTIKAIADSLNGVRERLKKDQIDQFKTKEEITGLIQSTVKHIQEEHMDALYEIVRDMVKQKSKEKKTAIPSEEEESMGEEDEEDEEGLTAYKDARAVIEMLLDVSYMEPVIEFYHTRHTMVAEQKKVTQQVDAARLSAKLNPKIKKLRDFLEAYDSQQHLYTLDQTQEVTEAYVNKKRAKLTELEALDAKQQAIIMGENVTPLLENKNTYPEGELNATTQSLLGNNNVDEDMNRTIDLGSTVHEYMKKTYKGHSWEHGDIKKVMTVAKELLHTMNMDSISLADLVDADDFRDVLFLSASQVDDMKDEARPSYTYKQEFYQRIQQDPLTMYDQLMAELRPRTAEPIPTLVSQIEDIHTLILGEYETVDENVSNGMEEPKEVQTKEERFMKQVAAAFEHAESDHLKEHVAMYVRTREACVKEQTDCEESRKQMELAMGYFYRTPEGDSLFEAYYRAWFRSEEEKKAAADQEKARQREEEERRNAERKAKEKENANYATLRGDLHHVLTDLREIILAVSGKESMTELDERVHENLVEVYDVIKRELQQGPPLNPSSRAERKAKLVSSIPLSIRNVIGQEDRVAVLPPGAVETLQGMIDRIDEIAEWILTTKKSNRNKNVQNYEEFMKPIRNQSSQRAQKIANAKAAEERRRQDEEEQARIRKEKEEANRVEKARRAKEREEEEKKYAALRKAQMEKNKGKRDQEIKEIQKKIDENTNELAKIERDLALYKGVKTPSAFTSHYGRIKGQFSNKNRTEVNTILQQNPKTIPKSTMNSKLMPILSRYFQPKQLQLQEEIKKLEAKVARLKNPPELQLSYANQIASQQTLLARSQADLSSVRELSQRIQRQIDELEREGKKPSVVAMNGSVREIQGFFTEIKAHASFFKEEDLRQLDNFHTLTTEEKFNLVRDLLPRFKGTLNEHISEVEDHIKQFQYAIDHLEKAVGDEKQALLSRTYEEFVQRVGDAASIDNPKFNAMKREQVDNDRKGVIAILKQFPYSTTNYGMIKDMFAKYDMKTESNDEFESYLKNTYNKMSNQDKEVEWSAFLDRALHQLNNLYEEVYGSRNVTPPVEQKKEEKKENKSASYMKQWIPPKAPEAEENEDENEENNNNTPPPPSDPHPSSVTVLQTAAEQARQTVARGSPSTPIPIQTMSKRVQQKLQNVSITRQPNGSRQPNGTRKTTTQSSSTVLANSLQRAKAVTNRLTAKKPNTRDVTNAKQALSYANATKASQNELEKTRALLRQAQANRNQRAATASASPAASFKPGMVKSKPSSSAAPSSLTALERSKQLLEQQQKALKERSNQQKRNQQAQINAVMKRGGGSIKRTSSRHRRITRKQKK